MRWLRANLLALIAVLALLAGTLGAHWWLEWSPTLAAQPWRPVESLPGVTEFGGARWDNVRTSRLDAADSAELGAPAQARVIAVGVRVAPLVDGVSCTLTLREVGGLRRQWTSSARQIEWPAEIPIGCDSERTDSYTAGAGFLVPLDAVGPFHLEVVVPGALPQFLRFGVNA